MTNELIANPAAELVLGSTTLVGTLNEGPYLIYALSNRATWGNPAPVINVVDSLLGDGQLASVVRHGNREAEIGVRIKATDGRMLAEAERALAAEMERPNILIWNSPDGFAPTTIFDVVTSWMEHVFDGDDENRNSRRYILHLTLYPHSRSASSTTVQALGSGLNPTVPPVETTISTADSLTGWDARVNAGVVDPLVMNSGQLYLRGDVGYVLWMRYTLPAATSFAATRYIEVDWLETGSATEPAGILGFATGPDGVERPMPAISTVASPLPGLSNPAWRRTKFWLGSTSHIGGGVGGTSYPTTVTKFRFELTDGFGSYTAAEIEGMRHALWVANLKATDGGALNDGTTRQLARTLDIGGSARAMGVIDIRHEEPLGDVIVWSGPAACTPQMRRQRVSGAGATVDADAVSGAVEDIGTTPLVADYPLSSLPSGAYLVMARLSTTASAGVKTIDVTAQTHLATASAGNIPVGPVLTLDDVRVDLPADPTRGIFELGVLHLPSAEVAPGSDGALRVSLSGADIRVDDAWLFNITDGDLTWVSDADEMLRLTSPTLADPRRRVWTGPSDDALSDAGSKTNLRGQHLFNPGPWSAFTITTSAQDAAVTVTYDKRWGTHAAEGA